MTNASVKNSFAVLFTLVLVSFASMGVFVSVAHAQDDDGGGDEGGGYSDVSYGDGGGDNLGYYDTTGDSNLGYYDTTGDSSDLGNYDTTGDNLGYYDTNGDNLGYYDTGTNVTEEGGVTYSQETYPTESGTAYSTYSTPMTFSAPASYSTGFSAPSFSSGGFSIPSYSTPSIPSAPIIQNIPVAYQQQQQQQQQQAPVIVNQPPVTNNTCVNYSCNTTTSISNSGNTTTVIPVSVAPVTYPAQYTFPQQTYNYQNVSCSISAYPNSVQAGQYTYLSWQSNGAISATLTSYGNVAPNGSLSIRPYGSTNYVLTVYGQNGQTSTCNTYITVGSAYITPSVTLSQIPYTGFDFGTLGDTMYWLMLAVFALSAGYLLVYYKGGMGAFAGSMVPARSQKTVTTHKVAQKVAPAPVAHALVEKKIETAAPAKFATLESLPAFTSVRPTSDSMTIASHDGAPRIVISRN